MTLAGSLPRRGKELWVYMPNSDLYAELLTTKVAGFYDADNNNKNFAHANISAKGRSGSGTVTGEYEEGQAINEEVARPATARPGKVHRGRPRRDHPHLKSRAERPNQNHTLCIDSKWSRVTPKSRRRAGHAQASAST